MPGLPVNRKKMQAIQLEFMGGARNVMTQPERLGLA
jgi:hypothetical protein